MSGRDGESGRTWLEDRWWGQRERERERGWSGGAWWEHVSHTEIVNYSFVHARYQQAGQLRRKIGERRPREQDGGDRSLRE